MAMILKLPFSICGCHLKLSITLAFIESQPLLKTAAMSPLLPRSPRGRQKTACWPTADWTTTWRRRRRRA